MSEASYDGEETSHEILQRCICYAAKDWQVADAACVSAASGGHTVRRRQRQVELAAGDRFECYGPVRRCDLFQLAAYLCHWCGPWVG